MSENLYSLYGLKVEVKAPTSLSDEESEKLVEELDGVFDQIEDLTMSLIASLDIRLKVEVIR